MTDICMGELQVTILLCGCELLVCLVCWACQSSVSQNASSNDKAVHIVTLNIYIEDLLTV